MPVNIVGIYCLLYKQSSEKATKVKSEYSIDERRVDEGLQDKSPTLPKKSGDGRRKREIEGGGVLFRKRYFSNARDWWRFRKKRCEEGRSEERSTR